MTDPLSGFTFNHVDQTDRPSDSYTAAEIKEQWDSRAEELRVKVNEVITKVPERTTANLTYYVRTDGSDSNTGLDDSSGGAFLTIGKAISMIPQTVNHLVTINVGAGTYAEAVTIQGKNGYGQIIIDGATAGTTTANNFIVQFCQCYVQLKDFTLTTTSTAGVLIKGCKYVLITSCAVTASASQVGIRFDYANGQVNACSISNRTVAIYSFDTSHVYSNVNGGSGNTIGLRAEAGIIAKNTTLQPTGAIDEGVLNGGQIL